MTTAKTFLAAAFAAIFMFTAQVTQAAEGHLTVGAAGYDLVSYHTNPKPLRGNGHNTSVHDGVTYLFSSTDNKATFDADPAKYVPAYGGYCAFGVSVGKKFFGDPEVWRVVDGRLYLNLDAKVQDLWLQDVPGKIATADTLWEEIKETPASEL